MPPVQRLRIVSRPHPAAQAAWAILALLLFLVVPALSGAQAGAETASTLTIESQTGPQRFEVEVADTPAAQARGLMYRRSLPPDAGMLFPFPAPKRAMFWMRNTYVALDLLFIAPDGRIESIRAHARPLDESGIESEGEVIAVLEILAGEAARRGIRPGDRVLHPALPPAAEGRS